MTSERHRLITGTSWTLFATLVGLSAGVILPPLLVVYVGIDGYGVWASAGAIASVSDLLPGGRSLRALASFSAGQAFGDLVLTFVALVLGAGLVGAMVASRIISVATFAVLVFFARRTLKFEGVSATASDVNQ